LAVGSWMEFFPPTNDRQMRDSISYRAVERQEETSQNFSQG